MDDGMQWGAACLAALYHLYDRVGTLSERLATPESPLVFPKGRSILLGSLLIRMPCDGKGAA